MRRIAPVLSLLAVAACAGSPAPMQPPAAFQQPGPAAGTLHIDQSDFDEMLDVLSASAPSALGEPTLEPPRAATPPPGEPSPYSAPAVSYQENLATCLDGRFPAFCDHDRLSEYDALRVREAEYQANLITCIDPQWQHLCHPELLPAELPGVSDTPSTSPGEPATHSRM